MAQFDGNTATYAYLANSPLVGQIAFKQNGTARMTTTKQYDYLNRLTAISSTGSAGASPASSFNYLYNTANQRTQVTTADNSFWAYQYDSLGQVISGKKYWSDGTPVAGQQFTYNFDDIGNRKQTASGGDASGANLRVANYAANNLNQYTSRDVPGYVDILGSANPQATVTVNLQRAIRQGSYFSDELGVNNSGGPLYLSLTNLAVLNNGTNADIIATNVGNVFVPQTPEAFGYDADGNLTNSGRWTITWDAENRAVSFVSVANAPLAAQCRVDCAYDWQGRRIQKIVSTNNGSVWVPVSTSKFVYDGWNLIAILDGQSSILNSFQWGTDLSGSLQGAGGVGGLISMTLYSGANMGTYFYAYDGNGNVATLVNAANSGVAGMWEYDPFGNILRATGPMAGSNPILFSTKFYDAELEFYYYGYRFYGVDSGRWLSRDPFAETTSINLYQFIGNDSANKLDLYGLWEDNGVGGVATEPNPILNESVSMLLHLGFGNLNKTYHLSDQVVELAKDRVRETDGKLLARKVKTQCGKSGEEQINYYAPRFSIEQETAIAHIGNWQIYITGSAKWTCKEAQMNGQQCKCDCKVQVHCHVKLTKVYTFRPVGFNSDNSKTIIQMLNSELFVIQGMLYGAGNLGTIDNPGGAYNAESDFDLDFTEPTTKAYQVK